MGEFPGQFSLADLLRMDVRDALWMAQKARQRAWQRRVETYNAALLPYQKTDVVEKTMKALHIQGLEFAYGETVTDVDRENARMMAEAAERKRATRRTGKRPKVKPGKRSSKIRRLK
jgi:hypothetical protein